MGIDKPTLLTQCPVPRRCSLVVPGDIGSGLRYQNFLQYIQQLHTLDLLTLLVTMQIDDLIKIDGNGIVPVQTTNIQHPYILIITLLPVQVRIHFTITETQFS